MKRAPEWKTYHFTQTQFAQLAGGIAARWFTIGFLVGALIGSVCTALGIFVLDWLQKTG